MIPRKGLLVPPRQGERIIDTLVYGPLGAARRTVKETAKFYKGKVKYRIGTSFVGKMNKDQYGALGKGESFPMPRLTGQYPRYPRLELLGQLAQKGIGSGLDKLNRVTLPQVRSFVSSAYYYAPKERAISDFKLIGKLAQGASDKAIMKLDVFGIKKGRLFNELSTKVSSLAKTVKRPITKTFDEFGSSVRYINKRVKGREFDKWITKFEVGKRALFPSTTYSARLARLEKPIGFTAEPLMMPSSLNVIKPVAAEKFIEIKSDKSNLLLVRPEPQKSMYYGTGQYERSDFMSLEQGKTVSPPRVLVMAGTLQPAKEDALTSVYNIPREKSPTGPRESGIIVPKSFVNLGESQVVDLGQSGRFGQGNVLGNRLDTGQRGRQKEDILDRVLPREAQKFRQGELFIQRPREMQRTRQILRYEQKIVPKIKIPLIATPERKPTPFVQRAKTKPKAKAFLVVTFKQKKPYLVSPNPLSIGQARAVGVAYTKRTARATFKLVPTERAPARSGIKPITEQEVWKMGYRPKVKRGKVQSGSNVFIQRKTTRMGTRPEVRAIQSYRRSTLW